MKLLNGLSRSEFLAKHWQKKPLLIQQAIANFKSPINKQQLIELSHESSIESRVVTANETQAWNCEYGPFEPEYFPSLEDKHWTLLVQSVDHFLPEVAELLELFDFIPTWRIDDIMISYANDGGSVGPHLDQYDVFLLQAVGQRQWLINDEDYTEDDLLEDSELKLLAEFNHNKDYLLKVGDMLYLPPGVAHHGIANGDCITISIGFRAPTDHELLAAFADDLPISQAPFFYTDPDLTLQRHCGEIDKQHIDYIYQMMMNRMVNDEQFEQWFGRYISEARSSNEQYHDDCSFDDFDILFKQHQNLIRMGDVRINFIRQTEHIDLFVAGQHDELDHNQLEFIQYLSQHRTIAYDKIANLQYAKQSFGFLYKYYQLGLFFFNESTITTN